MDLKKIFVLFFLNIILTLLLITTFNTYSNELGFIFILICLSIIYIYLGYEASYAYGIWKSSIIVLLFFLFSSMITKSINVHGMGEQPLIEEFASLIWPSIIPIILGIIGLRIREWKNNLKKVKMPKKDSSTLDMKKSLRNSSQAIFLFFMLNIFIFFMAFFGILKDEETNIIGYFTFVILNFILYIYIAKESKGPILSAIFVNLVTLLVFLILCNIALQMLFPKLLGIALQITGIERLFYMNDLGKTLIWTAIAVLAGVIGYKLRE
ncbi:MAG: hypothetical protein ABII22_07100 [Candidatus Micrarchaeota archaeon]